MAQTGKNLFLRGGRLWAMVRRLPHLHNLLRLIWRLLLDVRVPLYLKGMLALAVLYVLSPVDFIPATLLLVLGVVDDVAIVLMAATYFLRWCPEDVVAEHVATMAPGFQAAFRQWRAS